MSGMRSEGLDETDRQLLRALESDGRITAAELAKRVGMSAPAVTDRIRRLESNGVIRRFTAEIDLTALGYTLEAVVRIKPRPGNLHIVEQMIIDEERFTDCDKVTGDDCFIARLVIKTITELDDLLDPFHERAETNTSIIKSALIRGRLPI